MGEAFDNMQRMLTMAPPIRKKTPVPDKPIRNDFEARMFILSMVAVGLLFAVVYYFWPS